MTSVQLKICWINQRSLANCGDAEAKGCLSAKQLKFITNTPGASGNFRDRKFEIVSFRRLEDQLHAGHFISKIDGDPCTLSKYEVPQNQAGAAVAFVILAHRTFFSSCRSCRFCSLSGQKSADADLNCYEPLGRQCVGCTERDCDVVDSLLWAMWEEAWCTAHFKCNTAAIRKARYYSILLDTLPFAEKIHLAPVLCWSGSCCCCWRNRELSEPPQSVALKRILGLSKVCIHWNKWKYEKSRIPAYSTCKYK